MAQLWLAFPHRDRRPPMQMRSPSGSRHPLSVNGKFLSRGGQKFFLKAMRLTDVGATLDLSQKLKLRRRFDDLVQAHATGLILNEAQASPVLDIAAAAGLVAIVELAINPDEILDDNRWQPLISRVAHTANIYRGHSALAGYLIDCPIAQG